MTRLDLVNLIDKIQQLAEDYAQEQRALASSGGIILESAKERDMRAFKQGFAACYEMFNPRWEE